MGILCLFSSYQCTLIYMYMYSSMHSSITYQLICLSIYRVLYLSLHISGPSFLGSTIVPPISVCLSLPRHFSATQSLLIFLFFIFPSSTALFPRSGIYSLSVFPSLYLSIYLYVSIQFYLHLSINVCLSM